jgi:hypothetical protein
VKQILDHLSDPAWITLPDEGAPMGALLQSENAGCLKRSQRFSESTATNTKLLG